MKGAAPSRPFHLASGLLFLAAFVGERMSKWDYLMK
jgi:hypothetical protein